MLCLSQLLSADVEKKVSQIAWAQLLPLMSMSKQSRQKTKTPPKKNRFFADFCLDLPRREVWGGTVVDIEFLSELVERKHAQWASHAMAP